MAKQIGQQTNTTTVIH